MIERGRLVRYWSLIMFFDLGFNEMRILCIRMDDIVCLFFKWIILFGRDE